MYMQITINNKHLAITDLFTVLSIILEHLLPLFWNESNAESALIEWVLGYSNQIGII